MVIRVKTYIPYSGKIWRALNSGSDPVRALKSPISIIWPSEEKSAISCRIRFQRLFPDDW